MIYFYWVQLVTSLCTKTHSVFAVASHWVQRCHIRRLGGDVVLLLLLLLPGLVLLSSSPDTQRVVEGNTTLHSEVCLYMYVYT